MTAFDFLPGLTTHSLWTIALSWMSLTRLTNNALHSINTLSAWFVGWWAWLHRHQNWNFPPFLSSCVSSWGTPWELAQQKHNTWLVLDPTYPTIDIDSFPQYDWTGFYGDVMEAIPHDMNEPFWAKTSTFARCATVTTQGTSKPDALTLASWSDWDPSLWCQVHSDEAHHIEKLRGLQSNSTCWGCTLDRTLLYLWWQQITSYQLD